MLWLLDCIVIHHCNRIKKTNVHVLPHSDFVTWAEETNILKLRFNIKVFSRESSMHRRCQTNSTETEILCVITERLTEAAAMYSYRTWPYSNLFLRESLPPSTRDGWVTYSMSATWQKNIRHGEKGTAVLISVNVALDGLELAVTFWFPIEHKLRWEYLRIWDIQWCDLTQQNQPF